MRSEEQMENERRHERHQLIWDRSVDLFWTIVCCTIFLIGCMGLVSRARGQQPPNAPPVRGSEPLKAPQVRYSYIEGRRQAELQNRHLVVFVGTQPRNVGAYDYVPAYEKALEGYKAPCVVVTTPGGGYWLATLSAEATNDDILAVIAGKRVSRAAAVPFQAPPARPEAHEVDASVRSHAKGARFYSLRPLYQNMYTINGGRPFVNYDSIFDLEHHPFLVSGGMQGLKGWRSDKALEIPNGSKVEVWKQWEEVRAFGPVPRYRWKFPVGTVAYDVLSTDKGVFEVRTQTRSDDGWETKISFRDESARPAGYEGLQQSCASCHSRTGEIVDVPGRIYRRERWGSDGRFSWRPYDNGGNLDHSWPLDVK